MLATFRDLGTEDVRPEPLLEAVLDGVETPPGLPEPEVIETHISQVVLTDQFAFKLKRPVRFDFVDFSTPVLRRAACHEEVRLNRRLSPEVYLGVVPITRSGDGSLALDGEGEPIEWLVKMRRLPDEHNLCRRFARRQLSIGDMKRIAHKLAEFYRGQHPIGISPSQYRDRLFDLVVANEDELQRIEHSFDPELLDRIHGFQKRCLRLHSQEFTDRVRAGRIIDGHGDLRPEHIYLLPDPCFIDCLEFNPLLRQLDSLDEIAFLAMELARMGATNLASHLLEEFCRCLDDVPTKPVLTFYLTYRATVRAKVHALRAAQLSGRECERAYDTARAYLRLADRYVKDANAPLVVVIRGMSGTGKSTLSARLSKQLGLTWLSTDAIRRGLYGAPQSPVAFQSGLYGKENRLAVYRELFARMEHALVNGHSVVLDGTFLSAELRLQAAALAKRWNAPILFVSCRAPRHLAEERIASRRRAGTSDSDILPTMVPRQAEQNEPDPACLRVMSVDTQEAVDDLVSQIECELRAMLRADRPATV